MFPFLYLKSSGGLDSSISDWLINYAGGFVRRGLSGQIAVILANIFEIDLRSSILILQLLAFVSFYVCVYFFFKNIKFNRLNFLAIFCPLFILYPVAETEALGRKELVIFLIFILYLFSDLQKISNQIYFKIFLFPLAVLIWEPVIFFLIYIFLIDLFSFKKKFSKTKLFYLILSYTFIFLTFLFIYLSPISNENFNEMKNFLNSEFDESCYLSCKFVGNQSLNSFYELLVFNISHVKITYIIRYLLIIFVGYLPLFFLIKNSSLNEGEKFSSFIFKNLQLYHLFILAFIPSIILFMVMYDWGRVVHINYTFSLLSFFYLIKTK